MDEIELDGQAYISARRAAKENGYTADYIGQLIRCGKLQGRKVGRAWFVETASLNSYLSGETTSATSVPEPTVLVEAPLSVPVEQDAATNESENEPQEVPVHIPVRVVEQPKVQPVILRDERVPSASGGYKKVYSPRYPLLTYMDDQENLLPALIERGDTMEEEPVGGEELPNVRLHKTTTAATPQWDEEAEARAPRMRALAYGALTMVAFALFMGALTFTEQELSYNAETGVAATTFSLTLFR
jgi:hypothetical protein